MSNEVKVQLKQKTADGNNDLMPKTIADNVFVDETTTLSTKLTAMDESISKLGLTDEAKTTILNLFDGLVGSDEAMKTKVAALRTAWVLLPILLKVKLGT